MKEELAIPAEMDAAVVEAVLLRGDLKQLSATQKLSFYKSVCESLGLNPLTQPFAYILLNGKEVLYAKRECTEQLRKIHNISIEIKAREYIEGCYVVTASAIMPSGRRDESTGAVAIEGMKGEPRANALLKAETKAKRRVTLSICGLGMLDETEIESIPSARPVETLKTTEARTFGTPSGSANSGSGGEGKGSPSPATDAVKAVKQALIENNSIPTPSFAEPGDLIVQFDATPSRQEIIAAGPKGPLVLMDVTPEGPVYGNEEEFCTKEQQDYLRLQFKASLPMKYQAHADQLRRDWLKTRGYENSKGVGTSTMIPRRLFKAEAKDALKYAKEIKDVSA